MKDRSTAILVFSQHADQEVRRKNWTGQDRIPLQLIRQWNRETLSLAKSAGLPVLLSSDLIDHRGSFHEQINAAFNSAFDLDYDNILCIGNDCPGLNRSILCAAFEVLQSGKTVLGPDQRGGIYLIGIAKKDWNRLSKSPIPWQEYHLFDHLLELIQQTNEVYVLNRLHDIHSQIALRRSWLDGELSLSKMLAWQQIIRTNGQESPVQFTFNRIAVVTASAQQLRAPPSLTIPF